MRQSAPSAQQPTKDGMMCCHSLIDDLSDFATQMAFAHHSAATKLTKALYSSNAHTKHSAVAQQTDATGARQFGERGMASLLCCIRLVTPKPLNYRHHKQRIAH
jgi:hypothetical protein